MCNRADIIQWLNNYYDNALNFNRDEINTVTDFSLLWNLFESVLGERRMQINRLTTIATIINRKSNGSNFYDPYLAYFQRRYVNNNNTNNLFEGLLFRQNDNRELVRNVLIGQEQNAEKIIEAILIIIYRFRNNLFHGEKELHNIHTQYENFQQANRFIMNILEINKIDN